ncbi:MAG: Nif3-like dinuclear metal center hexameric protein [Candidatus Cardinium sp.]|nr:Nif3-like dinuclear metal center hexameric protein [Candidatus Cardinium sp.]
MTTKESRLHYNGSMVVVSDIVNYLEQIIQLHCPCHLIKSGLIVGDLHSVVTGVLICLDITEAVLEEAMEQTCNLLITYQPFVLQPLSCITPENYKGRCAIKAIKNNLSIYVFYTNLDYLGNGASHEMAEALALQKNQPLLPWQTKMYKLTTFAPSYAEKKIITALYQAGALLATYEPTRLVGSTAVNTSDVTHSILPNNLNINHTEEKQLTFTLPMYAKEKSIQMLWQAHPYTTVPYYLEQIELTLEDSGIGSIGLLPIPLPAKYFLKYLKTKLALPNLRHTSYTDQLIYKVAIYAGEGSWLVETILDKQIDAFITTDLQYAQFLENNRNTLLIDIGYAAARSPIKKLIAALLLKEFNNIAILCCKTITNPIYHIND